MTEKTAKEQVQEIASTLKIIAHETSPAWQVWTVTGRHILTTYVVRGPGQVVVTGDGASMLFERPGGLNLTFVSVGLHYAAEKCRAGQVYEYSATLAEKEAKEQLAEAIKEEHENGADPEQLERLQEFAAELEDLDFGDEIEVNRWYYDGPGEGGDYPNLGRVYSSEFIRACACVLAVEMHVFPKEQTTQTIARLDRTQLPPGYSVRGRFWSPAGADEASAVPGIGDQPAEARAAAGLAAAWAHYEREHDPPGLTTWNEAEGPPGGVWMIGVLGESGHFADYRSQAEARENAWAHYWRRVAVSARVDAEVVVLVEHGYGVMSKHVPTPRARVADALRPMLTMADDEDARQETAAEVERLFSEGRLTFEGDPPIELAAVDAWPRCLAWPDEQVAAVERWLSEGSELPEVLRA